MSVRDEIGLYLRARVALIVLGTAAFPDEPIIGLLLPLMIQGIGILASIAGIFIATPRSETESAMRPINRGFFAAAGIAAVLVAVVSIAWVGDWRPLAAVVVGLVLASVIQVMTSYYTATEYKPVREIAQSSTTGPATPSRATDRSADGPAAASSHIDRRDRRARPSCRRRRDR